MIDYKSYKFMAKELIFELIRCFILISLTGWLFFDSLKGVVILLPAGIFLLQDRKRKKREERLFSLREDFREFLLSFTSSVQAGYTMEQAVLIGERDLKRMYPGKKRSMISELEWMNRQMELGHSCDALFENLAKRSEIEEIRSFAVILRTGRRQGGNLITIIRRTTEHINKKIQVQLEMRQIVAGRMMEKNIMMIMPYFMLCYLRITNSEYIEALFLSVYGNLLMAVSLVLLWAAGRWADKVVAVHI